MTDRVFVDTNVLVYSRDSTEVEKQRQRAYGIYRDKERNECNPEILENGHDKKKQRAAAARYRCKTLGKTHPQNV
jgi:predicted nucleic acid-binding protein